MSKSVVVHIPHELGRAEARRRIESGRQGLIDQIGALGEMKAEWSGDDLAFSVAAIGQTVTGTMAVGERDVRVEVVLPGLFGMIAGKIKGRLSEQGRLLLQKPQSTSE